jgi:hypothetical protein
MNALASHFDAPVCHNCGAALATAYCGACGQKRAQRLDFGAVRSEAWQSYRLFEMSLVKGTLRFLRAPGLVAREFVLGARAKHIHPLKLLLVAIGLLLLVLARTNAMTSQHAQLSHAMELVRSYANWSFSLGILAIVGASWTVLRWRQPFNLTEHLVLGVYTHFLVIVATLVNRLPLLVWRSSDFVAAMPNIADVRIGARCDGASLQLLIDGEVAAEATDTDLAAGRTGLLVMGEKMAGTSAVFDDFALYQIAHCGLHEPAGGAPG